MNNPFLASLDESLSGSLCNSPSNISPCVSPQSEFSLWSCYCWIFSSSGEPGGQRSASTSDTAPPGRKVQQNKHTYTLIPHKFHLGV